MCGYVWVVCSVCAMMITPNHASSATENSVLRTLGHTFLSTLGLFVAGCLLHGSSSQHLTLLFNFFLERRDSSGDGEFLLAWNCWGATAAPPLCARSAVTQCASL